MSYKTLHEKAVLELQDDTKRQKAWDDYKDVEVSPIARFVSDLIINTATVIYGKKPSYKKFRAIEVIARIPYQSWEVFSYCAQTVFFTNERKALRLAEVSEFSRLAEDNETMHVVVISQLMKKHEKGSLLRDHLAPVLLSFFYWWASFILYGIKKKWSFDINYLFESHAYNEYQKFIDEKKDSLSGIYVESDFLKLYGREVKDELEFFELVRNDELLHRNSSIDKRNKFCNC